MFYYKINISFFEIHIRLTRKYIKSTIILVDWLNSSIMELQSRLLRRLSIAPEKVSGVSAWYCWSHAFRRTNTIATQVLFRLVVPSMDKKAFPSGSTHDKKTGLHRTPIKEVMGVAFLTSVVWSPSMDWFALYLTTPDLSAVLRAVHEILVLVGMFLGVRTCRW